MKKIVIALVMVLALGGCDWGSDAKTSAPDVDCTKPGACTGLTNAKILRQPDGFRNVSFGCFGPNGVYVTSRGPWSSGDSNYTTLPSSVFVVANDPQCAK